jgi:hypothetical protein
MIGCGQGTATPQPEYSWLGRWLPRLKTQFNAKDVECGMMIFIAMLASTTQFVSCGN